MAPGIGPSSSLPPAGTGLLCSSRPPPAAHPVRRRRHSGSPPQGRSCPATTAISSGPARSVVPPRLDHTAQAQPSLQALGPTRSVFDGEGVPLWCLSRLSPVPAGATPRFQGVGVPPWPPPQSRGRGDVTRLRARVRERASRPWILQARSQPSVGRQAAAHISGRSGAARDFSSQDRWSPLTSVGAPRPVANISSSGI
ncbi:hypothetical protein NDU88_004474 [Pleurodeles waltl]|uniref:Uncharacterized protein n=1 Tax=Pleurodeles waltl TaxID=8319 RepID=A0AAV7PCW1_PLEWA|nr:hypothetical protein NDU88_004474 [Pleurodeles waltl]